MLMALPLLSMAYGVLHYHSYIVYHNVITLENHAESSALGECVLKTNPNIQTDSIEC